MEIKIHFPIKAWHFWRLIYEKSREALPGTGMIFSKYANDISCGRRRGLGENWQFDSGEFELNLQWATFGAFFVGL